MAEEDQIASNEGGNFIACGDENTRYHFFCLFGGFFDPFPVFPAIAVRPSVRADAGS
jgi:hypothetical protein